MTQAVKNCRSFNPKAQIYDALQSLLAERGMNLSSVTISEVAERAEIGRATFYRHFDTLADVLKWQTEREVQDAINTQPLDEGNYYLFAKSFYDYWTKHDRLPEILAKTSTSEFFLSAMQNYLSKVGEHLLVHAALPPYYKNYIVPIWSETMWSILKSWILNGKTETSKELADITYRVFYLPPQTDPTMLRSSRRRASK